MKRALGDPWDDPLIPRFKGGENEVLRGDRPEHWLESLEPRAGWGVGDCGVEGGDSEIGQWGATGAFPKGEGEKP